ncbi:MAG TPA: hypothetical protein VF756_06220 [Thermoanaerobaculia bacterium]
MNREQEPELEPAARILPTLAEMEPRHAEEVFRRMRARTPDRPGLNKSN